MARAAASHPTFDLRPPQDHYVKTEMKSVGFVTLYNRLTELTYQTLTWGRGM